MKRMLWVALLLHSSYALALDLPPSMPVPGGIAVIELGSHPDAPRAWYEGKRVMVVGDAQRWWAVVGLGLNTPVGAHKLRVQIAATTTSQRFDVQAKEYATQRITIKDKRKVQPLAQDLKRIRRESAEMKAAFSHWRETAPQSLQFSLPADGPFSSPFGLRRFFNDLPRRPHSGLDIAAPAGTPVRAPAAGRVVAVGDYFFNGKTVMLDHGQGLITLYCHLQSTDVAMDQWLERGERLGSVGATGRATGPHLHWSVSLNNARVDPALFLAAEIAASEENRRDPDDAPSRSGEQSP